MNTLAAVSIRGKTLVQRVALPAGGHVLDLLPCSLLTYFFLFFALFIPLFIQLTFVKQLERAGHWLGAEVLSPEQQCLEHSRCLMNTC